MKKTLILLTTIFLAINASGQSANDIRFCHKQKFNQWKIENLAGKGGRPPIPPRQNVSGNNQVKSLLSVKQKLESDKTESWDNEAGKWVTYGKSKYTYDENLNCTLNLTSYWDVNHDQWLDFGKDELSYDASGNMTSFVSYSWDNYGKQWNIFMNAGFDYDAAGNCTLEYYSELNETTDQWEVFHKYQYSYDADERTISKVETWRNGDTGNWAFSEKEQYNYDASGNLIITNMFNWNDETSQWVTNRNIEYIYDSAGNNIIISDYYFSGQDSTRIETHRTENTYDMNRNRIVQVQNDWGEKTKNENTFDNTYSFEELILPLPYPEDYFRHMWTMNTFYSHDDTGWVLEYRGSYYYSEVNTSDLSSLEDKDIVIYPNPASQFISFDADKPLTSATFSLYDVQGRKVMTGVVENNVPVSVKFLGKGMYIYRISDDGTDYKGKLIIE